MTTKIAIFLLFTLLTLVACEEEIMTDNQTIVIEGCDKILRIYHFSDPKIDWMDIDWSIKHLCVLFNQTAHETLLVTSFKPIACVKYVEFFLQPQNITHDGENLTLFKLAVHRNLNCRGAHGISYRRPEMFVATVQEATMVGSNKVAKMIYSDLIPVALGLLAISFPLVMVLATKSNLFIDHE